MGPASADPWEGVDEFARQDASDGFKPTGGIYFNALISRITMAYEYAAKLTTTVFADDEWHVRLQLVGAKDRVLVPESPRRHMPFLWAASSDIDVSESVVADRLAAQPRELAIEASRRVLERFGASVDARIIRDVQDSCLGQWS